MFEAKCEICEKNSISFLPQQYFVCFAYVIFYFSLSYIKFFNTQAVIAQQDSRIELQHTFQSKSKQPARHYSSELLEQEKQRSLEKQKEEVINMHKMQAQYREEQQRWEKDRERQKVQIETLEAQLQQREEECRKWEEKLSQEKAELEELKKNYQQDLERLRESTKSVDKDKERLNQERVRLEQLQEKIKKNIPNPGYPNYDDSSKVRNRMGIWLFINIITYSNIHEFTMLTEILNVLTNILSGNIKVRKVYIIRRFKSSKQDNQD